MKIDCKMCDRTFDKMVDYVKHMQQKHAFGNINRTEYDSDGNLKTKK